MTRKIGAVITGGDFQALGAIRTLAKKGIPVIVLDSSPCISKYSKYTKKMIKAPPLINEDKYLEFLLQLANKENIDGWVILPNSDMAVCILSKNRDILKDKYRVPTPSWEVIENVYIKKNTYQLAENNKIPIPQTFYPRNMPELMQMDFEFPIVIKPSIRDHFYEKVKIKAFKINSRRELLKVYKFVCTIIEPSEVIVQEFIPGGPNCLYSFCPFFKNGEVVTSITARRSRQHPMDFGHASTFAELIEIPELKKNSEKFLKLIKYYGIGEIEFMYDSDERKYKLIEFNPRIWGWHTLAIAAGVDLAYILFKDMIGEKTEIRTPLKTGKWIRLLTDIPTVFSEISKGNIKISEYLNSLKGRKEFAVFSIDDPLPFLMEIFLIPYLWKIRGF